MNGIEIKYNGKVITDVICGAPTWRPINTYHIPEDYAYRCWKFNCNELPQWVIYYEEPLGEESGYPCCEMHRQDILEYCWTDYIKDFLRLNPRQDLSEKDIRRFLDTYRGKLDSDIVYLELADKEFA